MSNSILRITLSKRNAPSETIRVCKSESFKNLVPKFGKSYANKRNFKATVEKKDLAKA